MDTKNNLYKIVANLNERYGTSLYVPIVLMWAEGTYCIEAYGCMVWDDDNYRGDDSYVERYLIEQIQKILQPAIDEMVEHIEDTIAHLDKDCTIRDAEEELIPAFEYAKGV